MRDLWELSKVKKLRPRGPEAPNSSSEIGELIAVVDLRGGSKVMVRLSARGLANVAVRDWSNHFTFVVGDRLLPNSCHLGLPDFIRFMRRSRS